MSADSTAARLASESLDKLLHDPSPEVAVAAAGDLRLTEDSALALLSRRDLPKEALEAVSKNAAVMKSRKVMLAVVAHPRTPRHVSLPIARHLYTFELMSLALTPTLAADLKIVAEETIITRMETITEGERLTLARRGSTRVAAALLAGTQPRVLQAALDNPHLTEASVVKALAAADAAQTLVEAVCRHGRWWVRREVRIALLRNEKTPLARIIAIAESLPAPAVRELLGHSRLPENVRRYLLARLEHRQRR